MTALELLRLTRNHLLDHPDKWRGDDQKVDGAMCVLHRMAEITPHTSIENEAYNMLWLTLNGRPDVYNLGVAQVNDIHGYSATIAMLNATIAKATSLVTIEDAPIYG